MKSLVLFLLAALPLFTVAQTTDMEPQSGDTHSFPFDHYIDEGCGMYHISGTVTYRVNKHSVAHFEGTAVNVETGEEVPLHTRQVSTYQDGTYHLIINGVYPGKVQFHFRMRLTWYPEFSIEVQDFTHCIPGSSN